MQSSRSSFGSYVPTVAAESVTRLTDSAVSLRPPAGEPALSDAVLVPAATRATIRVLVVDDDRTLREGCASVLQVEGYAVTCSARGDEAVEMLQRGRFDIVMLDLYMTPIPGIEILKVALEANPHALVIMMTGNPSVATNIEALRAGAWDYLAKPFSGSHLHLTLGRAALEVMSQRERLDATTRKERHRSP